MVCTVSVFSTFFTDLTLNCQFVTFDEDFLDYCKWHICDSFSFFTVFGFTTSLLVIYKAR